MIFEKISKNIIACENFLPEQKVEEIYADLLNNRTRFKTDRWEGTPEDPNKQAQQEEQFLNHNCAGFSFWLNYKDLPNNSSFLTSLYPWLNHQGLRNFARNNKMMIYDFLQRGMVYDTHFICYNNGGHYGWHKDSTRGNIFTFNLILNKGDSLEGGDMLFMDDDKIIKIKKKHNFMVVLPSFIDHSVSPLKSKTRKDVSFLEQRFSLQYWVRFP